MTQYPIYLDYNATTPCDPLVIEAMLPYFGVHFGNAASKTHAYGWLAEEAVEIAREQVANLIHAAPNEIIFTSGSTESINLAIRGIIEPFNGTETHIITYLTEHKAVLDVCSYLQTKGTKVTYLPVNADGLPNMQQLKDAITPHTKLIAMMYANNETGVIMPVKTVASIAHQHHIPFFCDATQAVGKIMFNVKTDEIDLLCCSAHKMYGPKGCGMLYVKKKKPKINLLPLFYGGGHERTLRSGTLNIPGIVAMGKASDICATQMFTDAARLNILRNKLIEALVDEKTILLNGHHRSLLPHVANISFMHPQGFDLIKKLSKSVALSSGSACTSATIEPSHVLTAMGFSEEHAANAIRFSLGRFTTEMEIDQTIGFVQTALDSL